jgi:SH3 domain-containing protein
MALKREHPEHEQPEFDVSGTSAAPGAHDLAGDKVTAAHLVFRPLSSARSFHDQPAPRAPTVAWRVAALHASVPRSTDDLPNGVPSHDQRAEASHASPPPLPDGHGIALVYRRRQIMLLSLVLAAGITTGIVATSTMLASGLSQSVQRLAAAARGGIEPIASYREMARPSSRAASDGAMARVAHASDAANVAAKEVGSEASHGDFPEQLAAIQRALEVPQTAPPISPPTIAGGDGDPALSARDANGGPGKSEPTSPSHPVQARTTSGKPAALAIEEPAETDLPKVDAGPSPIADSALRSKEARRLPTPPLPTSAQGVQIGSNEARLRQAFEQFLIERQRAPSGLRDRQALFVEFKNSLANRSLGAAAPTSPGKEGTPRVEVWQALDTTNIRELASLLSTVIGTVEKGSTFRVIDRSKDGKWLKIETRDGSTGYYWAARARETR